MVNELRNVFNYFVTNNKSKESRNKIVFFVLITIVLLIVNKTIFINYFNYKNFQVNSALSNLLFVNGISPYSSEIDKGLENYFSSRDISLILSSEIFQQPIYQLLFYLPFSFVRNLNLAVIIWITINQLLLMISVNNCFQIINWNPKILKKIFIVMAGMIAFFGYSNYLSANTAIIQLFFLTMGLKYLLLEKNLLSGIFFGMATIDPFNFFIILIFIGMVLIRRSEYKPLIWSLIAIILLSLLGMIFDSGWVLKMLKNVFLNPRFYPFINYSEAIKNWDIYLIPGNLVKVIPLLLILWIFGEYLRMVNKTINHVIWLISLICCINPFIVMRESNYASVLYIFPAILIIFLWDIKAKGIIKYLLYFLMFAFFIITSFLNMTNSGLFKALSNFHNINLITSIFLIFMLYWIRWWIVKPYDYLTD